MRRALLPRVLPARAWRRPSLPPLRLLLAACPSHVIACAAAAPTCAELALQGAVASSQAVPPAHQLSKVSSKRLRSQARMAARQAAQHGKPAPFVRASGLALPRLSRSLRQRSPSLVIRAHLMAHACVTSAMENLLAQYQSPHASPPHLTTRLAPSTRSAPRGSTQGAPSQGP
jgi:hypothetical protein